MAMTVTPPAHLRERSDAELISATRDGDLTAYGELYRRHVDACTRYARRRCRDRHLADDVVSEVFAATLQAITNGRGPTDDLAPYVMRSVGHQVARACTRGDGGRTVPTDPCDLGPYRDPASADRNDQYDDQIVTTQAFRRLPDRFRHVLWATEVEGSSHADLGEQLGLREPAVAALARRARQAFANAYLDVRANPFTTDARCAGVRRTLASYVRGNVCSSTVSKIDDHLDRCPDCADVVAAMRQLSTSLRSVPWLAPAGVVGVSRWALLAQRVGITAGTIEIPKIIATGALGLSLLAGPTGSGLPMPDREAAEPPAAGLLDRAGPDLGGSLVPAEPSSGHLDLHVDLHGHERSAADAGLPPVAGMLDRTEPELLGDSTNDERGSVSDGGADDGSGRTGDPGPVAADQPSPGLGDAPTVDRDGASTGGQPGARAPESGTAAEQSAPTPTTPTSTPTPHGESSGSGGLTIDVLNGTASAGVLTPEGALSVDLLDGTASAGVLTPGGALHLDLLNGTANVGVLTSDGPVQVGIGGHDVGEIVENTVGEAAHVVDGLLDTAGDVIEQTGGVVDGLLGGLTGGLFGR